MQVLRRGRLLVDANPRRRPQAVGGTASRYEDLRIVRREAERAMLARIRKDRGDVDDGAAPGGPERGEGGLQSDEKGPAARRRPMARNARRTRVGGVRGHVWAPQTKVRRPACLARYVARRSRAPVPRRWALIVTRGAGGSLTSDRGPGGARSRRSPASR